MDTNYSHIYNAHPSYVENLYKQYKEDPNGIEDSFRNFFEGYDFFKKEHQEDIDEAFNKHLAKELKVIHMIEAYRSKGHLISKTNPIRERKDRNANLTLTYFGLSEDDLNTFFYVGREIGLEKATLADIKRRLDRVYTGSIGFEYNYIKYKEEKDWFKEKIERRKTLFDFSEKKREKILDRLNKALVFERFLGTKYVGEKRFSLEGGETAIPALHAILELSANMGTKEAVIGMAHRGRLNVLANVMGKTYNAIFSEFEDAKPNSTTMGDGDVKYHLGYSSILQTQEKNNIYIKLVPNPSHLEAVDPVVQGFARAKADIVYQSDYDSILPILIHGDSAVAGQGVVYEVLQMSKLKGYKTGGTIHFVINNQIGFTTSFDDARSSDYCTSVAATVQAPVLHVNGDDIEAVVFAAELAVEYRVCFNKDIFIDMVCYRKHGHNEGDDPKYTQPTFYKLISKHDNPRNIYINKLRKEGAKSALLADKMEQSFWKDLQDRLDMVKQKPLPYKPQKPDLTWRNFKKATREDLTTSPNTSISFKVLIEITERLFTVPEGFSPLRKIDKYLKTRQKELANKRQIDWASAELFAYASILKQGHDIRMSGQDVKRGTFSHRHAVIFDEQTDEEYNRLSQISPNQGTMHIHNSHLSEFAVLGFEFGYSIATPDSLVIWEAQFGDFANGAQTIIDNFIVSSESKWNRNSGIVLLLPHGYEGQGPEHSSAKLERFLQMTAEFNIQVANISSPANFFHILRRQIVRPFRKPLIIMSPKSLLRHPKCVDKTDEILKGGFRELIDDESISLPAKVRKLLFCSGKFFYDLQAYQEQHDIQDVALIRLEQLYPLPIKQINKVLKKYPNARLFWVQEEPANMGAWSYIMTRQHRLLGNTINFDCIARKRSASPATGYKEQHKQEQQALLEKAFA